MPIQFKDALKFVLAWEGGYTNHPDDLGGPTNKGITQKRYSEYSEKYFKPKQSVGKILDSEVKQIYKEYYWEPVRSKYLAAPLGLVLFDTSVNFGPAGAIRRLQKSLNLTVTGKWTQEISDVIHTCDATAVALKICNLRKAWRFYRSNKNPKQKVFLKGWLNRDNALINEVKKMSQMKILDFEEVENEENLEELFDNQELLLLAEEDEINEK
jgi:lysozyme family protein